MLKRGYKIDLGIIQDGQSSAKELINIAGELKGNIDDIKTTMRRIEGIKQEGNPVYKSLQNTINRITAVNKELGITTKIPELAEMEKALISWSDASSLKIQ